MPHVPLAVGYAFTPAVRPSRCTTHANRDGKRISAWPQTSSSPHSAMNYDQITEKIIVGSCPTCARDVDRLGSNDVRVIVCLQEPQDLFFEMGPIQDRAKELGIDHLWHPITDFDKKDLRAQLPKAVKAMNEHVAASPGVVYVHCTGGMHRSTAVTLAYQWWVEQWHLDDAYHNMMGKRSCAMPDLATIRKATADILYGEEAAPEARRQELRKADTHLSHEEAAKLHQVLGVTS